MLWGWRIKSLADERHVGLDGDAGHLNPSRQHRIHFRKDLITFLAPLQR